MMLKRLTEADAMLPTMLRVLMTARRYWLHFLLALVAVVFRLNPLQVDEIGGKRDVNGGKSGA